MNSDFAKRHPRAFTILICIWLVWFWIALLRVALPVVLPFIEEELGISHAAAGSLVSIQLIFLGLLSVPAGLLAQRYGTRVVLLASVLSTCALTMAVVSADTFPSLIVVFAGMGAAIGLYFPAGIALLSKVFPPKQFGRVMGIHDVAPPVASVVGVALLSAFVLGRFDWRVSYEVMLPVGLVLALALWFVVPREERTTPESTRDGLRKLGARRRDILLLLLPHTMNAACTVGALSMLPLFLVNEYGFSGQHAAAILAIVGIGGIFGPLVGGWLSDRWSVLGTPALYLAVSLSCLTFVILLPLNPLTYLAFFILFMTCFGYYPLTFTIIARWVPLEIRAPVNGLFQAVSVIAGGTSPLIIGVISDAFSMRIGYVFPVLAAAIGMLVLIFLIRSGAGTR